jgi:hypothetical protein
VPAAREGGYWGWKEGLKGTLSSLSLSGLGKAKDTAEVEEVRERPKATGYWEWQESIKKTLSTVSLGTGTMGNATTTTTTSTTPNSKEGTESETSTAKPPPINYWHWKNSFKSASDLIKAAETKEGGSSAEAPQGGGSYWFWRNPSMKSLSLVNLNQSGNSSSGTEDAASASTPRKAGGPITDLEHKMRNSWRKSFQKLSSNSLTKLDEGGADDGKATSWRQSFRLFSNSVKNLNKSHGSSESMGDTTTFPASLSSRKNDDNMAIMDESHSSDDGISF